MVRCKPILFVLLTSVFLLPVHSADALEGGPEKLKLGKVELQRNGYGIRKKGLLTLYEGSLYLQGTSQDAKAIVNAEQPMAIRIEITSGFVSQEKLLTALSEGFQTATGGNVQAINSEIQKFRECFNEPIKKNDIFVLSYIPEAGVLVHKNSTKKGLIPGKEFKRALFGIWLDDSSVDSSLRSAMLGTNRR